LRNGRLLRFLPLATSLLLAACASTSPRPRHKPTIRMTPHIEVEQGTTASSATTPVAVEQATDVWTLLRASFAMADCEADPVILRWARRYTQSPALFESRMKEVLPRLVYVQQVASQYGVAGEFALLPWVESQFQPLPGRKNRPAGIWQIMPVTAGSMGLQVDGNYDGRLDVDASARAVMKLLKGYHDQFHDWRVADYAYNAGEYKIRNLIGKHGMPPGEPVIPRWGVRRVTREHLAKLLAIACVVREPERFGVSLPLLPPDQHLVQVDIAHSMPVIQAAHHAGLSVSALKDLNAAFKSDTIDTGVSPYLMLPANHVKQFRDALLDPLADLSGSGMPDATTGDGPSPDAPQTPASSASDKRPVRQAAPRRTHKVKRGESLWQIAHRYHVDVVQLQRWNHLHGSAIKPGQSLQVGRTP
jgi:membrane-bound lytic murein transglycosylase D